MNASRKPTALAAGDRVRLLADRSGLKKGAIGTIIQHGTIKRERSISPDPSGASMFVVFDGIVGILTIPTNMLEKISD